MNSIFRIIYKLAFILIAAVALFLFSSCASVTFDAKDAGMITDPNEIPTLAGHTFGGWFYDDGTFTVPYSINDKIVEDVTVYAKWIPEVYTVTFIKDGRIVTEDIHLLSQEVEYGKNAEIPYFYSESNNIGAVTGWYLDPKLTIEWDPDSPITNDLTIYPKWGRYYDSVYFAASKIYIETEDNTPITSKEEYLNCSVTIKNTDESTLDGASARIRGRGNTTWTTISDKKAYRVKFDKKTDLFGMGREKDYVLIANYIDFTLMRNDLVYLTAAELELDYTTETEWVHLFLNGNYEGVYLLCEQTETGTHRVDIGKDDEPGNEDKNGEEIGFLIEVDGAGDHSGDRYFKLKAIRTSVGLRGWRDNFIFRIMSPDGEYITDGQFDYIKDYMTRVNRAIAIRDWKTLTELVDIDSLVNYFIVTEISFSVDMGWAFYMYKPAGEKLYFGPVWDYDQAFGNSTHGGETYNSWKSGEENVWFTWLLDSTSFKKAVAKRWTDVYDTIIKGMDDKITELYDKYKFDVKANFIRWDKAIGHSYWRSPEEIVKLKTYEENVAYLRAWLTRRISWMNRTISEW